MSPQIIKQDDRCRLGNVEGLGITRHVYGQRGRAVNTLGAVCFTAKDYDCAAIVNVFRKAVDALVRVRPENEPSTDGSKLFDQAFKVWENAEFERELTSHP